MASTARRDGDEYVLNGSKTFITNGPYADTIVFICKLDEGNPPAERKVVQFVLDSGMPGLEQSKPLRKMGLHSSPTGMLFLDDVRVGRDRLLGETEERSAAARAARRRRPRSSMERSGVAAMALGIIERCLELSVKYAKERVQFGKPIGEFQLIQLKLAKMEVARLNVENLVFRVLESSQAGKPMNLSEASAMKLYSAGRGDRGRARGRAALRRQRLHGRVRGRAARPRRQGAADLRGHRRDPGRSDRARAARLTATARAGAVADHRHDHEHAGEHHEERQPDAHAVGVGEPARDQRQAEAGVLDRGHDRERSADSAGVRRDEAALEREHEPGHGEAVDRDADRDRGRPRHDERARRAGQEQHRVA